MNLDEEGDFDIFGGTLSNQDYRADSVIPKISEEALRNTGQNYPTWVQERYLPLPASISERVLSLARELTGAEPTPYDRAIAIESYLREFPYTLEVPIPPRDQEFTDYFLFSLQKGYCDYYATAMVVLARAAGIPARLTTGYVAETFDEERQAYLVTADQAHSWVEIFFPGYGWVPFEPTAARQGITRQKNGGQEEIPALDLSLKPLIDNAQNSISAWLKKILISMLGILLIGLIGAAGYEWWFIHQPSGRLLPAVFSRIYRFGQMAGIKSEPGDTVNQFLTRLEEQIETYDNPNQVHRWLQSIKNPLRELSETYHMHLFGEKELREDQKPIIVDQYRQIRYQLLVLWVLSTLNHFLIKRRRFGKSTVGEV